jgi:hypothetical protein
MRTPGSHPSIDPTGGRRRRLRPVVAVAVAVAAAASALATGAAVPSAVATAPLVRAPEVSTVLDGTTAPPADAEGTAVDPVAAGRAASKTGYAREGADAVVGSYRKMTITLVASTNVESYRTVLTQAAADLTNATGLQVTVAAGTTTSTTSAPGIIRFVVSNSMYGTATCGGTTGWIGCGGYGAKTVPSGKQLITSGQIAVKPAMRQQPSLYTTGIVREIISHELGHVFGLAHFNGTYGGAYQAMQSNWHNRSYRGFGSGDINGLKAMSTVKAYGKRDFDCDGRSDTFSLTPDGTLMMTPGSGAAPYVAATAWTWAAQILTPGDLDGDSMPDLIVRTGNGDLYRFDGSCNGRFATYTSGKIGNGWNMFDFIAASADFNGDGMADLIARKPDGTLWMYSWHRTAFGAAVQIGHGWQQFTALSLGDYNGDRHDDLLATRADGTRLLYAGKGSAAGGFFLPVAY